MCPSSARMSVVFTRARPLVEERMREQRNLPQVDLRTKSMSVAQSAHLMGLLQRLKGRFSPEQTRVLRLMFPEGQLNPRSFGEVVKLLRKKCAEESSANGRTAGKADFIQ